MQLKQKIMFFRYNPVPASDSSPGSSLDSSSGETVVSKDRRTLAIHVHRYNIHRNNIQLPADRQ
ncbi:hypothetical protein V5J35_001221 [Endozoicomonas sp. NE40]|uniref:Uncharacterized protein n=1 Tax=Endozoicomonas lisbonensis TaxID=3120522 RepID=A0ABV2SG16_9GAMM